MGQSPSNLLAAIADKEHEKREAEDTLTSMSLLAELKQNAYFADVHYESSIEGDMLLPLDKVVRKGRKTYCNVSAGGDVVDGELQVALGHLLRADVVDAVKVTVSQVLAEAIAETNDTTKPNYIEKRHFSIVVGHLGGIYRLNYLLFVYTYRSAFSSTCQNYLVSAWALSSVRLDWLALNAVNIAIEQSFLHAEGESHEDFRKRIDDIKVLALQDWDDDQVREAAIERRKRKAGREETAELNGHQRIEGAVAVRKAGREETVEPNGHQRIDGVQPVTVDQK